jgi:hypothetical protein
VYTPPAGTTQTDLDVPPKPEQLELLAKLDGMKPTPRGRTLRDVGWVVRKPDGGRKIERAGAKAAFATPSAPPTPATIPGGSPTSARSSNARPATSSPIINNPEGATRHVQMGNQ